MKVPVPLVGPSNTARVISQSAERTVNLYLELSLGNPRVPVALIGTPGLSLFLSPDAPMRGWHLLDGRLFIVFGTGIYDCDSLGALTLLASLSSSSGYVHCSDNAGKVVFGDGTGFFVLNLDTNTLTQVSADGDPLIGTYSQYIDGYTLYLIRDSGRWYNSSLNDPETVDGLAFEEAEGDPDDAVNLVVSNREVIVIGVRSTEYFTPSGDTDIPFARIDGGFIEAGCSEPRTVVEMDSSVFWVGQDDDGIGIVRRLAGYRGERISNNAVEKAIAESTGELTAYAYQEEGHTFYCLNTDNTTWCYDASLPGQIWHERAWTNPATGFFERQRQSQHIYAFGRHLVSDYETGDIYTQSLDVYADNGLPLVAMRRFQGKNEPGRESTHNSLEILMETGVGLDGTGQGSAPVCMLRFSNDSGRKWSQELRRSIGAVGNTLARVVFRRLGRSRQRIYELKISDPVRRYLTAAIEDVS